MMSLAPNFPCSRTPKNLGNRRQRRAGLRVLMTGGLAAQRRGARIQGRRHAERRDHA